MNLVRQEGEFRWMLFQKTPFPFRDGAALLHLAPGPNRWRVPHVRPTHARLAVAAVAAALLVDVVAVHSAPAARDVALLARLLAHARRALGHASPYCGERRVMVSQRMNTIPTLR